MIHLLHRHEAEDGSPKSSAGLPESSFFDAMWFGDANFPLGEDVFTALLTSGGNHMFVMPTTRRGAEVTPAHAFGHYDPQLGRANQRWRSVAATELAQQVAAEHEKWNFGSPWVFCNELSYSQWRASTNDDYRRWTVAFAQTLADVGLVPAVYSPITDPRSESDKWAALAAVGYIAIEGYLDAASVVGAGDPVDYCAARYGEIRSHYQAQRVPIDRCVLVEHYAQTPSGTGWGRGGLPLDDWLNIIPARVAGARAAGFALLGSFGWGYNRMQVPDDEIVATATAYVAATQNSL